MAKKKKKKKSKKNDVVEYQEVSEPVQRQLYRYRLYSEDNALIEKGEVEIPSREFGFFILGGGNNTPTRLHEEIVKTLNFNTGKTYVYESKMMKQVCAHKNGHAIFYSQLLCNPKGDHNYWDNPKTERFTLVFSDKPHIQPTKVGLELDMNKEPQTKGRVDVFLEREGDTD